jgi:sterol desaturase/sphingolipid hydroxylase (fatty acid hydroxylase superfamily)
LFWVVFKKRWQHRNIQQKPLKRERIWSEFGYSLSTVVIFSCIGFCIILLKRAGHTLIYDEIGQFGWAWFIVSIGLMLLLHDAYFYWTHRLMHHPKIFRHVHLVHHRSTNPSPWAAYSFHPIEAVIEAGIFVLIVFTIPAHPLALLSFLVYMIGRNVLGHLGIEFFPNSFMQNKWVNWHTTTTHHDLHHKHFNGNYGLYFTWWDRWFGTERSEYRQIFEEVTSRPTASHEKETMVNVMAKKAVVALFFTVLAQFPANAQSPVGTWQTIDDGDGKPRSTVQIEAAGKGLTGKVLDLFPRSCEPPDPVCDRCPGTRRGQPVKGMNILWGFKKSGNEWTGGSILDPANGKTYRCTVWLEDADTLKVRGYWGLFWRTQTWKRMG